MAAKVRRAFVPAASVVAVAVATGCGSGESSVATAPSPTINGDELASHDGAVCPDRLPIGKDPDGYGFGVDQAADTLPTLLAPEAAWVCEYPPKDNGRTSNGDMRVTWDRSGDPAPVAEARLPELEAALKDLELERLDGEIACTADLGPRRMLVYSHHGDLTGVVIDDYGCRDVRLTDEFFTTPPGEATSAGTVPGVLSGAEALLHQVNLAWGT